MSERLRVLSGPDLGGWIPDRLTGSVGSVTGLVPDGYPAYARILHAPRLRNGGFATWRDVANIVGGTLHPQVQWQRLVNTERRRALERSHFPVGDPPIGSLDERSQRALKETLSEGMKAAQATCFAYAAIVTVVGVRPRADVDDDCSSRWDVEAIIEALPGDDPTLNVGGVRHLVLGGSVTSMPFPGQCLRIFADSTGVLAPTSPNLMWSVDRSWIAATDPEFDSTIVAGTEKLVDCLIGAPGLEALRVSPKVRFTARSDRLN